MASLCFSMPVLDSLRFPNATLRKLHKGSTHFYLKSKLCSENSISSFGAFVVGWSLQLGTRPHPGLRLDFLEPVGGGRDPAEVFLHVLLADEADGDFLAVRVRNGHSEDLLA